MKKLMAIGLAAVMAFGLAGCGGSQSAAASSKSSSPTTPGSAFTDTKDTDDAKETHSAEMEGSIDYEISRGITDYGEKSLMLTYTNNTNHPILSAQFYFELKDDLTDEDNELLSKLQEEHEIDDDQMDWAYFQSNTECYTDIGESSKPSPFTFFLDCFTDETYCTLADYGQVKLIFLDGEKYYQTTYDFYSQTFTSVSPYKNAYEWMTSDIGLSIPQPEGFPTMVSSDDENYGFVYVYNVSLSDFETYVDKCKEAGFSKVDFDGGDNVTIVNDEGTELSLYYEASSDRMVVRFG